MNKKVLNLYAGLGGNRKFWHNCDVTAVEFNSEVAEIYKHNFPDDTVIVGDAHKYLLEHYQEFDMIWTSPPCQSHSRVRFLASKGGSYAPIFPDMKLYEEIIFLKHFFNGKWVVENVKPYYNFLIQPSINLGRHFIWSNFEIEEKIFIDKLSHNQRGYSQFGYFDLSNYKINHRKDQLLRNCVNPLLGLYVQNVFMSIDSTKIVLIEKIPSLNY